MKQVFVTARSIYHLHGGVCTKVRDRETQRVTPDHPAQGATLAGGFARGSVYAPTIERLPRAGEHLCFASARGAVVSSVVEYVLHVHDGAASERTFVGFEDDDDAAPSYGTR